MLATTLYLPAKHDVHSLAPALALNLPAKQGVQVALPAAEWVPAGQELEPEAPTRVSCVTGPVAVHTVEASMGRASYTEWKMLPLATTATSIEKSDVATT